MVEPDLSVPGAPSIFVVGDLATLDGPQAASRCPASRRSRSRRRSTRSAGDRGAISRGRPRGAFRYRNPGDLATIGRAAAVADLGWIRFAGWLAWLFWLFVHILKLTGFRNRLVVFVQWAWAYVTFQRSIRLITGARRRQPAARRWRDAPRAAPPGWRSIARRGRGAGGAVAAGRRRVGVRVRRSIPAWQRVATPRTNALPFAVFDLDPRGAILA